MFSSNTFVLSSPYQPAHGQCRSQSTRALSILAVPLQTRHGLLLPSPSPCLNSSLLRTELAGKVKAHNYIYPGSFGALQFSSINRFLLFSYFILFFITTTETPEYPRLIFVCSLLTLLAVEVNC